jgi:GNAT superfamily N-acetyltransferase
MQKIFSEQQQVNIRIRNLLQNESYILDQIAEIDGRNPGLNDGEFLFNADRNGFIAAIEGSTVNGTISCIKYPDNMAFIGFHYIVDRYRNSGLWEKLLEAALNTAIESSIGLNSREEYTTLYEKAGFKSAFKIITYEGIADGKQVKLPSSINSPHITPYDKVYDYCKKTLLYEQKLFLNQWFNQPRSLFIGKYEDDTYKGIGLLKPCRTGFRLGPLIAEDPISAMEILASLTSHYPVATRYYLDIPEINIPGINLAEELKLKKIKESFRMYKGKDHRVCTNNIYSFTSMELG